jgi:hypothetical protein
VTIKSAEEFVRLRMSKCPEDYNRAAREEAAADLWFEVIERFPEMREWVAINKRLPPEVIAHLAEDPDARVRMAIAMKRSLSPGVFESLSVDRDEGVRARLAANRKLPSHIAERLSHDPSPVVSAAANCRNQSLR